MPHAIKKSFAAGWCVISVFMVCLAGADADVVNLSSGRQLGGPESFIFFKDGKVVIVDASGGSEAVSLDDVISMKLEGTRRLELKNGDALHVKNIVFEEESISFKNDILGEKVVAVEDVVGISGPAGRETPDTAPQAQQQAAEPAKKWSGNVQFGYASTSGREDTQNANLGAEAVRETTKTRLTLNAAARYGETGGEKNVDAQEGSGKLDTFLTERLYLYSDLGLLRDSINFIDLRMSPGFGVGRKFITDEKFSLEGEAGVAMFWERHSSISGEKETESNWHRRIAARFKWKLAPGAEFSEELEVFPGLSSGDEFRCRSVSQITAALSKKLSLAAGFTVEYDKNPPEGAPRTSTNGTTGLIYKF